jgi:hypothetical protein
MINGRTPKWLVGFRRVARTTDERTALFAILPRVAAGDSLFLMVARAVHGTEVAALLANLNSLIFDYVVRQKVGGANMSFFYVQQFPVLPPESYQEDILSSVCRFVSELTYTSREQSAIGLHLGYGSSVFRWSEERRLLLRCELDALYFHLYKINRLDAEYILDTFPIVRRKEEARFGEYRSKRLILGVYDDMAQADRLGVPYQSRLDTPPVDTLAEPPR